MMTILRFILLAAAASFLATLMFASGDQRELGAAGPKPTPTPKKTKPKKDDPDAELDAIVNEKDEPRSKPGKPPEEEAGGLGYDDLELDEKPAKKAKTDDPDAELDEIINEKTGPVKPKTKAGNKPTGDVGDLDDDDLELDDKPATMGKPPVKNRANDTPTDEVPADIKKNTGQVKVTRYAVFVLTNASNGLYVGSTDGLIGKMSCDFVGGGPRGCKAPKVTYEWLSEPRLSLAAAQQDLCDGISETKIFPLGIGKKGKWTDGKWYGLWDASVDGCKKSEGTPK